MNEIRVKISADTSDFLCLYQRNKFQNMVDNNQENVSKLKISTCNYYLF